MKKNTTTNRAKNLKMNNKTYELRRKVIDLIYYAHKLVGKFDRIEVRITEEMDRGTVGLARMNDRVLWIPETTIERGTNYLKAIVFHEILHALKGVEHNEECPLMCKAYKRLSNEEIDSHFKKYFK